MKKMDLAEGLYCIVMCAVMIFFGFAAGVWAGENQDPKREPVEAPAVEEVKEEPVKEEESEGVRAIEAARDDSEQAPVPDPMIEDTFLVVEHPLSLDLQVKLYGACLEMGVDYQLALAVIEQETGYGNLVGDDGASVGYMQVQEKWHQERMALLGVDDLLDPEGNFRVGCHFLRECIDKYGLERGLGYYNSGRAVVTEYSREVLGRMG